MGEGDSVTGDGLENLYYESESREEMCQGSFKAPSRECVTGSAAGFIVSLQLAGGSSLPRSETKNQRQGLSVCVRVHASVRVCAHLRVCGSTHTEIIMYRPKG